ncbi:MAG: HD domain-containing protein, partial [bacterium]
MSDRETEINEIIEQIKKEWVIKDWIDSQFLESKENNYDELLNYVIRFWYGAPTEPPFTEHGIGHCRAVERNIQRIVELYRIKLNIQEKFLLSATSYLHDISLKADWEKSSQDIFRLYEDHHIKSASLLMEKYLKIGLDETFASIISVLIKFHRKKEDLNNCPQKSILDNGFVRPRLISAIFRLGDAIHVDSSRVREPNWRYLLYRANIPLDVKFHWIKSFLVPAIALNASDKTIDVQINIPDVFFREDQRENAMNQRIGLLGSSIRQLLQEEVDSVNHVLSKYSRFVISEVRYMINQIPDNRKNRNQELIRFIFDYSATYSPSASMVIETALENIIQSTGRFYREQFNAVSDYWNIMNNLVNSTRSFLEEFLKDRPCHLGLNNMCRIIESIGK